MKAQAQLKFARTSPRKARLVADMIRGKDIAVAQAQLPFTQKKTAYFFKKLLDSAVANAVNNHSLQKNKLFISEVFVDEGPVMKRFQPRAFGRAFPIHKMTSHITLVVEEKKEEKKTVKKEEVKKPEKAKKEKKEVKEVKKAKKDTKKQAK